MKIKAASVSLTPVFDKAKNLEKYFKYMEEAAAQKVDLLCFPELSLQCFPLSMCILSSETTDYQQQVAELVPEGESCQAIMAAAKKHNMYICWGMTERDGERSDVIYNSAVLVGPEGYVGTFRKVHNPGCDRFVYYSGNDFPVFDTKIGKIGMMICYDRMFPEAARCLKLRGAEIIICPTAWPSTSGANEDDYMVNLFKSSGVMRAIENTVNLIDSNNCGQVGKDGVEGGHSEIINAMGEVMATTGFDEGMAVVEFDPVEEIRRAIGHGNGIGNCNYIHERRPYAYGPLADELQKNYM